MEKYLVVYEEIKYYNCYRFNEIKHEHFDDLDKAIEYITMLEAFGEEWDSSFDCLLEVKEIPVDIPASEIEKLREKKRQSDEERMEKHNAEIEEMERERLKELKEKYEE